MPRRIKRSLRSNQGRSSVPDEQVDTGSGEDPILLKTEKKATKKAAKKALRQQKRAQNAESPRFTQPSLFFGGGTFFASQQVARERSPTKRKFKSRMPPNVSDDEIDSDGPEEVPAKSKAKSAKQDDFSDEDNKNDDASDAESDEEDEEEDEYKVEKIIKHDFMPDGTVKYLIKWEGYEKKSDRTWEPTENLENAKQLLKDYHKSIGGIPSASTTKKRGPTAKRAMQDAAAPVSAKRQKAGVTKAEANGKSTEDPDNLPEGDWETHIVRVTSIVEEFDKKGRKVLSGLVQWDDEGKTQHPLITLRRKAPQKLLDYYEQHLVFHSDGSSD